MVNRHHITPLTSHKPHRSCRALFCRPAGHGPLHTDENKRRRQHVQPCAPIWQGEVEGQEQKDFQPFKNDAVKLLSNIQSRTE